MTDEAPVLCFMHKAPMKNGVCAECEAGFSTGLAGDRSWHRFVAEATCDLYWCPNSGRVIDTGRGDDKVLCPCGSPNKNSAWEVKHGITGLHLCVNLRRATEEDFWRQKQIDLAQMER